VNFFLGPEEIVQCLLPDSIERPFFACTHVDSGNSTLAYEVANLLGGYSQFLGDLLGCEEQLSSCGNLLPVVMACRLAVL